MQLLVGAYFPLGDFGPYGIITTVCCYNHCHANAVTDFGHRGIIFMTLSLLL
jgi:hypothetical protein